MDDEGLGTLLWGLSKSSTLLAIVLDARQEQGHMVVDNSAPFVVVGLLPEHV